MAAIFVSSVAAPLAQTQAAQTTQMNDATNTVTSDSSTPTTTSTSSTSFAPTTTSATDTTTSASTSVVAAELEKSSRADPGYQGNPFSSQYLYNFIKNSREMFPNINDMTYGNYERKSANCHTPWGTVCRNENNNGIKMVTNSGMVLWEQYIADHPNLISLTSRFEMTVEATTYAPDQDAIIVLTRSYSARAGGSFFYLIAYDATSGAPIAEYSFDNIVTQYSPTVFNNADNNYSNLSLVYNPVSQTVYCYSVVRAANASRVIKPFVFDRSNLRNPFRAGSTSAYLRWRTGATPNQVRSQDFLIDLAVDDETGYMYGMFQSNSSSEVTAGRGIYVIPFDASFNTIMNARGRYMPINEVYSAGTQYLISPEKVFRADHASTENGYWYGMFYAYSGGRQKVYRFAIPLVTDYAPYPGVVDAPSVELIINDNSGASMSFDCNKNMTVAGMRSGNHVVHYGYSYTDLIPERRSYNSLDHFSAGPFSVSLTNEDTTAYKTVTSKLGHFEQWVDGQGTASDFTPMPMIPLDYRASLLNYTSSGSSLYPGQVTTDMLQGCSDAMMADNRADQGPVGGSGLWAMLKKSNSNTIDKPNIVASKIVQDDGAGSINFDITIPYTANGTWYQNTIPGILLQGFKKFTRTTITESSVDVNRFNSVPEVAGTSGVAFRERAPTELNTLEVQRVLMSLVNQRPLTFQPGNIIIDPSTFVYNYREGTMLIPKVDCNLWYDGNGRIHTERTTLTTNIKLTGFYQGNETFFDTTANMIAPQHKIVQDFLNPDELYPYLYSWLRNAPFVFDPMTDFQVDLTPANAVVNANQGILTLKQVYLKRWNDKDGRLHVGELSKPYELTITGFISIPTATSVRPTYVEYLPLYQPTDINDDHIKTVLKQISFNLPLAFDESNISFKTPPVKNNLDGTITVEPIYNLTYDDKGILQTTPVEMGTVVLRGYKAVQPTTVGTNWDIAGFKDYATDFAYQKDFTDLKTLICSNITNLPFYHYDEIKNFDTQADIIIDPADVQPNNVDGSLTVQFKLKKYYDDKGIYHFDDAYPKKTVTITGFRRIFGATSFEPSYQMGYTSVSPQNITIDQLKKLVVNLGKNIPPDLKAEKVIIKTISPKPNEGTYTFTPILPYYYDDKGNPQTVSKEFPPILLKGFKKVQPTKFDPNRWIFGTSDMVAEKLILPQNIAALKQMLLLKIINAPDGFGPDDIRIVQASASNRQGTVSVSVQLQRYYDANGNYKADGKSQIFNITISGFFTALSKTDIQSMLDAHNPWTTPQEVLLPDLKKFLIANFTNLPPDFKPENIILDKGGYEVNNKEGTLTIPRLVINYYFDPSLKMQMNQKTYSNIVIKGYKKTLATVIPNTDWNIGNNTVPATEFVKDENAVKELIAGRIINIPDDFDPELDIKLSGMDPRNSLGSFRVSVSLMRYYDIDGLLQTKPSPPQQIIVSGFSIVNGATSFYESINAYQPNNAPADLGASDVQKILFDVITNPPPGLTPDQIGVDGFVADNTKGIITVKPTLKSYYDINQQLQVSDTPYEFPQVTIYGFSTIKGTVINNFWAYGNNGLTPEEALVADPNALGLRAIIANNVINKPIDFNQVNDIDIISTEPINTKGSIRVVFTLKKFYDKAGIEQTSGFPQQSVDITGYQTISQTIIPTTGWNIGTQANLASDFLQPGMQDTLKQMIYRRIQNLPTSFNYQENIVFTAPLKPNNFKGELTVSIKVKQGYGTDFGKVDFNGTSPNLNQTFTISGFYSQLATVVKENAPVINYHDFVPEIIAANKKSLIDLVYANRQSIFENLPADFSPSDIIAVTPVATNNKAGTITIKLSIKNYYQEGNGNLINDTNVLLTKQIVLTGFATNSATKFKNNNVIYLQSLSKDFASSYNAIPSQWTEKWKKVMFDNLSEFMTNLPTTFNPSDILTVTVANINNVTGTCDINVKMKNYFKDDSTCSLQVEPNTIKFTVGGFKKNNQTEFNDFVTVREMNVNSDIVLAQNFIASDIFNNNITGITLRQIVQDNIHQIVNHVPGNFVDANIKTVTPKSYDNLTGEVVVSISITNFYNEVGINETVKTLDADVTIKGFKQVVPTTFTETQQLSGVSGVLATSLTDDDIKTLVYNYRTLFFGDSLPACSLDEFKTYFAITNTVKNNAESKVTVNANLGIYYNAQGVLIKNNAQPKPVTLDIVGFKQNGNNTTIRDNITLDNYADSLASYEVNKDPNFIANTIISYKDKIFINAPLTLNTSDLEVLNVATDNKLGTISFDLNLFKYYDSNGVLAGSKTEPISQHVVLGGFQRLTYTSIGSIELGTSRNIVASIGSSQFSPSYYKSLSVEDAEQQLEYLLESRMSKGSINNKVNTDLIISDFKFDPSTANDTTNSLVVTFTLTNFITDEGVQTAPQSFTLTINGFGTYQEGTLSKDTLYYILVAAVVYLSILSSGVIGYVVWRGLRWKKGRH